MKIDTSIDKIQVIILANTRELIRQIEGVINVMKDKTGIKVLLGEKG
jgi:superfamily II DNA/RNA helicase